MSARGPVDGGTPAGSDASAEFVELLLTAEAGEFLNRACEHLRGESGMDLALLLLNKSVAPDRYEILASHRGAEVKRPLVPAFVSPSLSRALSPQGGARTADELACTLPLFEEESYAASALCSVELKAPQEGTHALLLLAHRTPLGATCRTDLERRMAQLEPRVSAALANLLLHRCLADQWPPAAAETTALSRLLQLLSERDDRRRKELAKIANGIAHDNNNLLQLLRSYLELLQLDERPLGVIARGLETGAQAVEKSIQLCRQLAAYALPPPVQPEPLGVATLLDSSKRLLRLLGPRGSSYQLEHLDGNPITSVSEAKLITALVRILQSAEGSLPGPLHVHIQTCLQAAPSSSDPERRGTAERVKIAVSFGPRYRDSAPSPLCKLDEGELGLAKQVLEGTDATLESLPRDEKESMKASVVLSLPRA